MPGELQRQLTKGQLSTRLICARKWSTLTRVPRSESYVTKSGFNPTWTDTRDVPSSGPEPQQANPIRA